MIKLLNIFKKYGELTVLKNISLTINKAEYVAIMGPSGSGKSTLMNIVGLLDTPTSGQYWLDKTEVSSLSQGQQSDVRGRKIGFVFQAFNLLPRMDSLRQVMQPLLYQGLSRLEAEEKAKIALESVGLADRMNHLPNELSGGQRQRVSIARALVIDPVIILADEPTGALDSKTGEEIMLLLKRLNDRGVTIVMVTHEHYIAEHANRTIHFLDGVITS